MNIKRKVIERKILDMLNELKPYEKINLETELIISGVLDSLSIFSLVTQLEEELSIEINEDEITTENFSTIKEISCVVARSKIIS